MAQKLGKLMTCDRCGMTVFLEKKDDKRDISDGYLSALSVFEDPPGDWTRIRSDKNDDIMLCTDCAKLFYKLCDDFMDNGRVTHAGERTDILL